MTIKSELKWCCELGWSGDATIGIEDFRKGIENYDPSVLRSTPLSKPCPPKLRRSKRSFISSTAF
jgi:hypothetical protein